MEIRPAKHPLVVALALLASCAAASCIAQSPVQTAATDGAKASGIAKRPNPLNAKRAMGYLSQLCKLGPRPSGSDSMAKQQAMLTNYFEDLGGKVTRQPFFIRHPLSGKRVRCANLIVEWSPEKVDRVLLCAHYDTRPFPDRDPDPGRRRSGTFLGANDGASGVAALMEIAHHLKDASAKLGIDFVLFDAEELVVSQGRFGRDQGKYFLGSNHFASQYRKNPPDHRYHWGVLLDMVGDANLEIKQEQNSVQWAETRPLVKQIWTVAGRLGVKEFSPRLSKMPINDDHVPLNEIAKIPTIDLIDAEYPDVPFAQPGSYWHTEQDIPANCSGESLAKVGWVVLEWWQQADVPNP